MYLNRVLPSVGPVTYDARYTTAIGAFAMSSSVSYPVLSCRHPRSSPRMLREAPPTGAPAPRLLDRVRAAVRLRHYSRRTEKAYVAWIRRFILFHDKRHPMEMSAPELIRFLSSLAVDGWTSPGSTASCGRSAHSACPSS